MQGTVEDAGSIVQGGSMLVAAATAVLGLLSGWAGAYLRVKGEKYATREEFLDTLRQVEQNTRTVEAIKAEISIGVAVKKELRDAVRAFTESVGALVHSMCWLTWDCKEHKRLDSVMAKRYDTEVHQVSPLIVGQLAVISMLDRAVAEKLAPLATDLFALDVQMGNAIVLAEKEPTAGVAALTQLHAEANRYESRFREQVVSLLRP